ncbi:MAG: aminotransferase class I/II-fold pyridoxal phosphate-dependent enzyme, partial [Verrucomicrobia bacterium]|nr:aminotransferase class I/II-fold pyridoxal phosphate-dependent enzyme [Verrucomicrobiota bacterium]
LGVVCALLGRDDVVILDKLVHACLVDAARLSGAKLRVFAHNDLDDLEDKLKWAGGNTGQRRVLVVTESVFSMDGDAAPLRQMVEMKEKHGAWLMVDEAHATGILGKDGRGLAEELGVSGQIEIQMGTLGKALGASGGFVCGSRALVDFLVNRARTFIFSTAPVPAAAAGAAAGVRVAQSPQGRRLRQTLRERSAQCRTGLAPLSGALGNAAGGNDGSGVRAILPLILGDEAKALDAAAKLRERNIFVPAIRYPTVARGAARLRVTLTAAHSAEDVSQLIAALKTLDLGL